MTGMTGRVVTFGEMLLRLGAHGHERFLQSSRMEAVFGGAEANVAVALARWGVDVTAVTVLPDSHAVADAAVEAIAGHGVDVSRVLRRPGRLGLYFVETGADARPSRIVYDRADSAFSRLEAGEIDWKDVFSDAAGFHVTGITPALGAASAAVTREAIGAAGAAGLRVSFDLNYRENLWGWGARARDVLGELASRVDLLIANAAHLEKVLGIDPRPSHDPASIQSLAIETLKRYPNLRQLAVTVRETRAGVLLWRAHVAGADSFHSSRVHEIRQVVDRIGAGDAFAAGLLYGLNALPTSAEALEFAIAAGRLKHSIPGDVLRASVGEVAALAAGRDGTGRVDR
jgi:2-dehydro-3-deoxygluconokinase